MQELFTRVVEYLRGAWRFRWQAMLAAWAVAGVGWVMVYSLPDTYEARARVFVDTESVLKPLLSGLAVNTDVTSEVNMMSAVLFSRPNLERVARETDLYLRATTPQQFESLVADLPKRIVLVGGGRDSTYTLTYSDNERAMAQRVVQTLLNTFVEDTLGIKRADSNSAQRFLEEQIRDYEKRLKDAEDRLAAFKQQNLGLMPGERGDYYTRLQTSAQNTEQLRAKLRLATERRNELIKQLEGEEPTFGLMPVPKTGSGAYDSKIAEMQKRMDTLLLQYTEKHPDVIALREAIAELERKKLSAVPPPAHAGSETLEPSNMALHALDINPVYQSMKIALSQTEVEIVEVRSELNEEQRKVNELRGRVDTIPQVEAQLAQLNRDYEVNKAQHTALLQRLESARLSDSAEHNTQDIKFRIIEPPAVPLKPAGPKRPLLLTVVLLFALGAGVALAVITDQLRPVFSSRAMLRAVTGRVVLGSVRRLPLGRLVIRERRQNYMLAGAAGLLLLAYVGALLIVNLASSGAGGSSG